MDNRFMQKLLKKKLSLVVSLPCNDLQLAKAAWENGADIVKIHLNVEHRASKTSFKSFEEESDVIRRIIDEAKGPCGIVVGGDLASADKDFDQVVRAGFDFISLYAHHAPVRIFNEQTIAKMLAVDYTYTDLEIKNLSEIGVDVLEASIMRPETYAEGFSARDLLQYRRLASLSTLPIVVPTQHNIQADDVKYLQECQVKGIMIGSIVTGNHQESLAKAVCNFRNAIDKI